MKRNPVLWFVVINAMLIAMAFLLTLLSFPLPLFPSWLKIDFADVPVLIGGCYCAGALRQAKRAGKRVCVGLLAVLAMELLKNLLNILLKGASFGGIGELANFLMGISLCVPAVLCYAWRPTLRSMVVGSVLGVLLGAIAAVLTNVYLFIPATGISMEGLHGAMTPLFKLIGYDGEPLWGYALCAVVPFNLLKMAAQAVLGMVLYRRLRKVLSV